MRRLVLAMLYTGFLLGANAAAADVAAAKAAATGEMARMIFADTPKPVPDAGLVDIDNRPQSLESYAGKWKVLNFWATWCGPCRKEMPSLQRLQAAMPDLAVVPIATGRNTVEGIRKFYEQVQVTELPDLCDPDGTMAHRLGVIGLPVTLIVNPQGEEVARLIGGAEWDSPEALALMKALMD